MGTTERRERERLARRGAILAAAKEVFFAKGLAAATVDEIAERAELGKGTLYFYFRSKEAIYFSLMAKGLEILRRAFDRAVAGGGEPPAQLRHLSAAYYDFARREREYFRILFTYYHSDIRRKLPEDLVCKCDAQGVECLRVVADVIARGRELGHFGPIDPWEGALLFWTSANGALVVADQHGEGTHPLKIDAARLLDARMEVLLGGFAAFRESRLEQS